MVNFRKIKKLMIAQSNYNYLSKEENQFINETQKLFESVKTEFAEEIKITETLKYDCDRIQISRDFLEATIKLRNNSYQLKPNHELLYFTEYEFQTHQEMVLVILCRIYDKDKPNKIKNDILDNRKSIKKLYDFFGNQTNFELVEEIDAKILHQSLSLLKLGEFCSCDSFPNLLQIKKINSKGVIEFQKLENLCKESCHLFEMLKIKEEYRKSYLFHYDPIQNISFLESKYHIYLNLSFQELLDKTLEFVELILVILKYTDYEYPFRGLVYTAEFMFEKLEKALILEDKNKSLK